ncbi:MAG: formate dehydrogenase accessory sulfurtransferase FdhD [Xanthomonadales bacterium]|nr:formate dehydrogenase accessory sulfurtransferase FdhD [Xanthomonadales bacterium]
MTEPPASKTQGQPAGVSQRSVWRIRGAAGERVDDVIADEVPVALVINETPFAVMMATPCDLEDFALGFCLSEAIIEHAADLHGIDVRAQLEGVSLALRISPEQAAGLTQRQRGMEGRSGCGLCGASTLEQVVRLPAQVPPHAPVSLSALRRGLAGLAAAQPLNAATGATHAAAWLDPTGKVLALREDVGRHNALDKVIGAMHRSGLDSQHGLLLLTSRASYEMVMKAATVGIHTIAAISAPTALAITLADQAGVSLIGFARGDDCVIYTHAEGISKD